MKKNLLIKPYLIPEDLSINDNGSLDSSKLVLIDEESNVYLYRDAALAWKAIREAVYNQLEGLELKPVSSLSGYRTLEQQERFFLDRYSKINSAENVVGYQGSLWKRKKGAPAAVPGTSAHGLGIAIDIKGLKNNTPLMDWMLRFSAAYGWSWELQSEPWHMVYCGVEKPKIADGLLLASATLDKQLNAKWLRPPVVESTINYFSCHRDFYNSDGLLVVRSLREKSSPGVSGKFALDNASDKTILLTDRKDLLGKTLNPALYVNSVFDCVETLVRRQRNLFKGKLITITGSSGKTTTKHFLSRCLKGSGSTLVSALGNLTDTLYATASQLKNQDFAIFETAQGSLPRSAVTLQSDIAILTSVSPAHMERYSTLEELAVCKAGVFAGGKLGSFAIINRDIPFYDLVKEIAVGYGREVITYGFHTESDFKIESYNGQNSCFKFYFSGESYLVKQSVAGEYISLNALAVIATLHAMKMNWPFILRGFERITRVLVGRGSVHNIKLSCGNVRFLNHAYNSNPGSVAASLKALSTYPKTDGSRHIAVLSDMLEMGSNSSQLHFDLHSSVLENNIDILILVGSEIVNIKKGLPKDFPIVEFSTVDLLFSFIGNMLNSGDTVVFNGSNGTGLLLGLQSFIKDN